MAAHSLTDTPVCDAILLWSFPKCGRTWLRFLFLHLYDKHLAAEHFVEASDSRFKIVLVRNVLDAMVSYYFEVVYRAGFGIPRSHTLSARWLKTDKSLGAFVRCGAAEAFFDFYDECAQAPGEKLLVRYEDLRNDTVDTVTRITGQLTPIMGVEPSTSEIAAAISVCSFESMRALETSEGGIPGVLHMGTWLPNLKPGSRDNPASFKTREGKVGGHTAHLSEADIAFLTDLARRRSAYRLFYPSP